MLRMIFFPLTTLTLSTPIVVSLTTTILYVVLFFLMTLPALDDED
jgi:NADH:ubiquinone oxidoreductase subunit 6 (subunit J)